MSASGPLGAGGRRPSEAKHLGVCASKAEKSARPDCYAAEGADAALSGGLTPTSGRTGVVTRTGTASTAGLGLGRRRLISAGTRSGTSPAATASSRGLRRPTPAVSFTRLGSLVCRRREAVGRRESRQTRGVGRGTSNVANCRGQGDARPWPPEGSNCRQLKRSNVVVEKYGPMYRQLQLAVAVRALHAALGKLQLEVATARREVGVAGLQLDQLDKLRKGKVDRHNK